MNVTKIVKGAAIAAAGGATAAATHAGIDHVSFLQHVAPLLKEILATAAPIIITWILKSPATE